MTKNVTADTLAEGKDVQYILWDFHILQVVLVKQRSVIKFTLRLKSRDQYLSSINKLSSLLITHQVFLQKCVTIFNFVQILPEPWLHSELLYNLNGEIRKGSAESCHAMEHFPYPYISPVSDCHQGSLPFSLYIQKHFFPASSSYLMNLQENITEIQIFILAKQSLSQYQGYMYKWCPWWRGTYLFIKQTNCSFILTGKTLFSSHPCKYRIQQIHRRYLQIQVHWCSVVLFFAEAMCLLVCPPYIATQLFWEEWGLFAGPQSCILLHVMSRKAHVCKISD